MSDDINYKAWARNMMTFIRLRSLEQDFKFWSGGWPCPVESSAQADEIERLRDRTTCLSGDIYRLRAALELADRKLGGEFMRADTAEVRAAIAKALRRG